MQLGGDVRCSRGNAQLPAVTVRLEGCLGKDQQVENVGLPAWSLYLNGQSLEGGGMAPDR